EKFIKDWQAYTKNPKRTTNDPMEAHVIGFAMWVKAVEKVKSTDPDKVIDALPGIEAPNLTGGVSKMLPNHHITKPVFIGEIKGDGQFDVVWKTDGLVPGDAWSKELEASKDLIGDWVDKKCGNYNTKTNRCGSCRGYTLEQGRRRFTAASATSGEPTCVPVTNAVLRSWWRSACCWPAHSPRAPRVPNRVLNRVPNRVPHRASSR